MGADSIFALASGPGRAGVAVFRLSGSLSAAAVERLTGQPVPPPRRAVCRTLRWDEEVMDEGLVLWFPAPASFTGEDVAELHVHGGRAIAQAVGQALIGCGLRPAEAGEFSRRAFLNGKMDLTKAEAIADLVEAETAAQRRQALRQLDGGLYRLVEEWRARLVHALALMEAVIDFSDEGVPDGLVQQVEQQVAALKDDMCRQAQQGIKAERLRDGLHLAIVGAPNAGKSSLLNRLAGREAAIVSAQAGTTRDVIEVHLDLHGWPVVIADTAGLREAAEEIEAEGIRRALARAESADLILALFDASRWPSLDNATLQVLNENTLVVLNKCDEVSRPLPTRLQSWPVLCVSARTGQGLEELLTILEGKIRDYYQDGVQPSLTRERHRAVVEECVQRLHTFSPTLGIELAAEDLRAVGRALGRITGRVDVDELLDVVFKEFCIGK